MKNTGPSYIGQRAGELGWKIRKSIDCDIIEYRNKSEGVI